MKIHALSLRSIAVLPLLSSEKGQLQHMMALLRLWQPVPFLHTWDYDACSRLSSHKDLVTQLALASVKPLSGNHGGLMAVVTKVVAAPALSAAVAPARAAMRPLFCNHFCFCHQRQLSLLQQVVEGRHVPEGSNFLCLMLGLMQLFPAALLLVSCCCYCYCCRQCQHAYPSSPAGTERVC